MSSLLVVLGKSSRIRSGWTAVAAEGLTGALSAISIRKLPSSRAVMTLSTLALLVLSCAAAQDNKSANVAICF